MVVMMTDAEMMEMNQSSCGFERTGDLRLFSQDDDLNANTESKAIEDENSNIQNGLTINKDEFLPDSRESNEQDSEVLASGEVEQETPVDKLGNETEIPNVSGCTELLMSALSNKNQKIYARSKALLQTPEAEFSKEKLDELTQFSMEFSLYSSNVDTSSVIMSTGHYVQEGEVYLKAQEVDYFLHGSGFKKRAPILFAGKPISTVYARMAIAKINGVENNLHCGSERLRNAARAIKVTKVEGADQIAALIEWCGVDSDLNSLNNADFNALLDAAIETIDVKPEAVLSIIDDLETSGSDKEDSDGDDDLAISDADDENSAGDDDLEASSSGGEDSNGADDLQTSASDDEDVVSDDDLKTSDSDDGDSAGDDDLETSGSDETEKQAKQKRFLNQEPINITLTNFIKSVDKLLGQNPPKYKLEMIKFDEARTCLNNLEAYVKGESAE